MIAYGAAKAAVVALMRAVADEGRESGIRANAVAPTAIRTGDNLRDMGDKASYVEREEVAEAVMFLCSDAARAISGQVIRLG
jgi:NAD(P)-dependent dehydrogenase (short-subunit alcohol dehydrogenase family)